MTSTATVAEERKKWRMDKVPIPDVLPNAEFAEQSLILYPRLREQERGVADSCPGLGNIHIGLGLAWGISVQDRSGHSSTC